MADHVIVLGLDGTVEKQGPFESLHLSTEFMHSLVGDKDSGQEPEGSHTATEQRKPIASNINSAITHELEVSRRTGDLTLYKYYLKSIGLKHGLIYLSVAIAYMFTWKFPRK